MGISKREGQTPQKLSVVTKKYKILKSVSIDLLEKRVESYLADGWKLEGGVAVNLSHCFQAVTKTL